MTGDVLPLLLVTVCLFLTPAASLPSKTGSLNAGRDISQTDLERLLLNTIETAQVQSINRQSASLDEMGDTQWKAENTWKTPTLPDLIKDWKASVKERQDNLEKHGIFQDIEEDDLTDKRSRDYGWGMAFGKRGLRTQNELKNHKMETRNKEYGWGTFFGKRNEYGWGHMFGKRNDEQVDYDDFVA